MKSQTFTLASGASLVVTPAPMVDADALTTAVIAAIRGLRFDPAQLEADMSGLLQNPAILNEAIDKLIAVATSADVKRLLMVCAQRAAYENVRVDGALFDDENLGEKARADYFPILQKILEVNVKPFFSQALSGLKALAKTPAPAQQ